MKTLCLHNVDVLTNSSTAIYAFSTWDVNELFSGQRDYPQLDLAARAAWLYYIAENTQEEIAAKLNVSRQAAQRLVALAVSEKLIKLRLEHPVCAG